MKKFFKFFSLAYIIIFMSSLVLANHLGIDVQLAWVGWIIVVLCGMYVSFLYAMKD